MVACLPPNDQVICRKSIYAEDDWAWAASGTHDAHHCYVYFCKLAGMKHTHSPIYKHWFTHVYWKACLCDVKCLNEAWIDVGPSRQMGTENRRSTACTGDHPQKNSVQGIIHREQVLTCTGDHGHWSDQVTKVFAGMSSLRKWQTRQLPLQFVFEVELIRGSINILICWSWFFLCRPYRDITSSSFNLLKFVDDIKNIHSLLWPSWQL